MVPLLVHFADLYYNGNIINNYNMYHTSKLPSAPSVPKRYDSCDHPEGGATAAKSSAEVSLIFGAGSVLVG